LDALGGSAARGKRLCDPFGSEWVERSVLPQLLVGGAEHRHARSVGVRLARRQPGLSVAIARSVKPAPRRARCWRVWRNRFAHWLPSSNRCRLGLGRSAASQATRRCRFRNERSLSFKSPARIGRQWQRPPLPNPHRPITRVPNEQR